MTRRGERIGVQGRKAEGPLDEFTYGPFVHRDFARLRQNRECRNQVEPGPRKRKKMLKGKYTSL